MERIAITRSVDFEYSLSGQKYLTRIQTDLDKGQGWSVKYTCIGRKPFGHSYHEWTDEPLVMVDIFYVDFRTTEDL
jgi:hypothetical protein